MPIARTCPYINKLITQGNCKKNADWHADGLFSTTLPLTRPDSTLSMSLSTTYNMGEPQDKCQWTAYLNCLVSTSLQQCPVQEPHRHFCACTNMLERNRPCYKYDHLCCGYHTTVISITPLLRVSHLVTILWHKAIPNKTCSAFHRMASRVIKYVNKSQLVSA